MLHIEDNTDYKAIEALIQEEVQRTEQLIIRTLQYVGEMVVNTARSNGSYLDQTGNLRSSVGAVVVKNGKIVGATTFNPINEGSKGSKEGEDYAKKLAAKLPNNIALIVVAGKDYAIHVANRGYDVLDSPETAARTLVPEMLRKLVK